MIRPFLMPLRLKGFSQRFQLVITIVLRWPSSFGSLLRLDELPKFPGINALLASYVSDRLGVVGIRALGLRAIVSTFAAAAARAAHAGNHSAEPTCTATDGHSGRLTY